MKYTFFTTNEIRIKRFKRADKALKFANEIHAWAVYDNKYVYHPYTFGDGIKTWVVKFWNEVNHCPYMEGEK